MTIEPGNCLDVEYGGAKKTAGTIRGVSMPWLNGSKGRRGGVGSGSGVVVVPAGRVEAA